MEAALAMKKLVLYLNPEQVYGLKCVGGRTWTSLVPEGKCIAYWRTANPIVPIHLSPSHFVGVWLSKHGQLVDRQLEESEVDILVDSVVEQLGALPEAYCLQLIWDGRVAAHEIRCFQQVFSERGFDVTPTEVVQTVHGLMARMLNLPEEDGFIFADLSGMSGQVRQVRGMSDWEGEVIDSELPSLKWCADRIVASSLKKQRIAGRHEEQVREEIYSQLQSWFGKQKEFSLEIFGASTKWRKARGRPEYLPQPLFFSKKEINKEAEEFMKLIRAFLHNLVGENGVHHIIVWQHFFNPEMLRPRMEKVYQISNVSVMTLTEWAARNGEFWEESLKVEVSDAPLEAREEELGAERSQHHLLRRKGDADAKNMIAEGLLINLYRDSQEYFIKKRADIYAFNDHEVFFRDIQVFFPQDGNGQLPGLLPRRPGGGRFFLDLAGLIPIKEHEFKNAIELLDCCEAMLKLIETVPSTWRVEEAGFNAFGTLRLDGFLLDPDTKRVCLWDPGVSPVTVNKMQKEVHSVLSKIYADGRMTSWSPNLLDEGLEWAISDDMHSWGQMVRELFMHNRIPVKSYLKGLVDSVTIDAPKVDLDGNRISNQSGRKKHHSFRRIYAHLQYVGMRYAVSTLGL